jgi:hypothetical protein
MIVPFLSGQGLRAGARRTPALFHVQTFLFVLSLIGDRRSHWAHTG